MINVEISHKQKKLNNKQLRESNFDTIDVISPPLRTIFSAVIIRCPILIISKFLESRDKSLRPKDFSSGQIGTQQVPPAEAIRILNTGKICAC